MFANTIYYTLKPFLPWRLRVGLRKLRATAKRKSSAAIWPIDFRAGAAPPHWPGWPEEKQFAFVLSHDVESAKGADRIARLMEIEEQFGFRASFNLVPEGTYRVSDETRAMVIAAGGEIGVHGLKHDGRLYKSKPVFAARATAIRRYCLEWGAVGFRSPLMQHKLGWLHRLGTEYDASIFDTDPFEPEPDGARTIFPFWVSDGEKGGYVELPYTLVQDFTLFIVLNERDNRIWKQKLEWVVERGGMVLMNTHPDYMCFDGEPARDEYPVSYYAEFLEHVRDKYEGRYWHALPREVAGFYRRELPEPRRNTRRRICVVSARGIPGVVEGYAQRLANRGDLVDVIHDNRKKARAEVSQAEPQEPASTPNQDLHASASQISIMSVRCPSLALSRLHLANRYDAIHVIGGTPALLLAALCMKSTDVRLIWQQTPQWAFPGLRFQRLSTRVSAGAWKTIADIVLPSALAGSPVTQGSHAWSEKQRVYLNSYPRMIDKLVAESFHCSKPLPR